VTPSNYGSVTIPNTNNSPTMEYKLDDLENGVAYFVRIRNKNAKGYGYAASASPSPTTPMK